MLDTQILNSLQAEAIDVLVGDTQVSIKSAMNELYKELGFKNAKLHNVADTYFLHNGTIYPVGLIQILPYGRQLPNLHTSLLTELNMINTMATQDDLIYIKNFFIAVVSQSRNAIVLSELLPYVLIDALKKYFTADQFKIIDTGVCGALQQEPISDTRQNIIDIKKHYKATIATLQRLLMDKWLLQQ